MKEYYIELAKIAKTKHLEKYPNYQYKPRKPSEKKRRVTRRKNSAMANAAHSQSASSDHSAAHSVEVPSREVELPIPEVPKNSAGNAMLELGDQDLDEKVFEKMVVEYNKSLSTQPNRVHQVIAETSTTPVIYNETSEDAQNDGNFYLAQQWLNPFEFSGLAGVEGIFDEPREYEDVFASTMEYNHQPKGILDVAQEETIDNVLARMSSAFDED